MWRPAHPIAIELPGRETRHEDMPGVVRAMPPGIEAEDAGWLGLLRAIEQPQFHPGGALGEHAEVDPLRGHTWPGPPLLQWGIPPTHEASPRCDTVYCTPPHTWAQPLL